MSYSSPVFLRLPVAFLVIFVVIFQLQLEETQGKLIKKHDTYGGTPCFGGCDTHGLTYSWCYTDWYDKVWDYCSAIPGTNYYGDKCKSDSPCASRGQNYNWCYLEKGGWDYCSPRRLTSMKYFQQTGRVCHNECSRAGSIYKCDTGDGIVDTCSPFPGLAVNLDVCTSHCDFNGGRANNSANTREAYFWCQTELAGSESAWNYCSWPENWFHPSDLPPRFRSSASISSAAVPFRTEIVEQGPTNVITSFNFNYKSGQLTPGAGSGTGTGTGTGPASESDSSNMGEARKTAQSCIKAWKDAGYVERGVKNTIVQCGTAKYGFQLNFQENANCNTCWTFVIQANDAKVTAPVAQVTFPFKILEDPSSGEYQPEWVAYALIHSLKTGFSVDITTEIKQTSF